MKLKRSIHFKAAFLMMVFSLNTVIGFACAIGINMGFNSIHHHEEVGKTSIHGHADGKNHIHSKEADRDHHNSTESKDNCCHHKVTDLAQVDKSVPESFKVINPNFFLPFSTFYNFDTSFYFQDAPNNKYFVRSYHPLIPDIRLSIQSFQI